MLKKILMTIIVVLTVISNANAIIIVPSISNTHEQTISRTNSSIIGKDYHGCKVVDAFYSYSNSNYEIICLKDGQLYRDSYRVKRIETKCDGWKCEDWSKDIPALFEKNVNK